MRVADTHFLSCRLAIARGILLFWAAIALCAPAMAEKEPESAPEAKESLGEIIEEKAPREPESHEDQEEAEKSVGSYAYWDDGWHLTGPRHAVDLLWNAKIDGDAGSIDADRALQAAFPDLEGDHSRFRRASLALLGDWKGKLQYKIELDFADARSIKDEWVRFTGNPILSHFTFGHMKEPYSLDQLISSTYTTYMERSLPTRGLTPSRNIGVAAAGDAKERRLTWAGGVFVNTGSISNGRGARDEITNANGYNVTGRLTWLPHYEDEGRRLTHLGLSLSHRIRSDDPDDPRERFRSRPESLLTDDRLVDTGEFVSGNQQLINLEAAWMNGPLSLQGEYSHVFVDAARNLDFDGWHLSGSYVLTGEHRAYRRSGGVFGSITPARPFRPSKGDWGAVEAGLRLSAVDLSDKSVRGGKERNITLGVNWYLRRKIRLMVNYIHANVQGRAAPAVRDSDMNIIMARFQTHF